MQGSPCEVAGTGGKHWLYRIDSGNRSALRELGKREGKHDVIIDDGGHTTFQQLAAFEVLFLSSLREGGLYIIEDIETSFWANAPKPTTAGEAKGDKAKGATNTVDFFLEAARGVNRFFFDREAVPCLGMTAASLIESVMFGQNCVIITKGKASHAQFTRMPYRFHHMVKDYKP